MSAGTEEAVNSTPWVTLRGLAASFISLGCFLCASRLLLKLDYVCRVINPDGGRLPQNVLANKAVNARAYQFLIRTFEPGDSVYVFGFSRGAYTARALCGMLHIVGLLTEGNEGLIPYAIRMIKRKKIDFGVAADFKRTFSRECKPYFVAAWDTVSSLEWIYDAVHLSRPWSIQFETR